MRYAILGVIIIVVSSIIFFTFFGPTNEGSGITHSISDYWRTLIPYCAYVFICIFALSMAVADIIPYENEEKRQ